MASLVQARIDDKIKIGAERVLKSMGMSLNDGIRIFLNQVKMEKALPFRPMIIAEPNEETLDACRRADSKIGLKKVSFAEFKRMLRK
jgi:addiction module RelB/DinJ family antitoxin